MSKIENPLGPGFEWRLRAVLNRVQPPHNTPRYLSATATRTLRTVIVRAAPAVAVGIAGLLLTAYAATGSPNPVTWTQNAASAINSVTHGPEPTPTAEPSSAPVQQPVQPQSQPISKPEPARTESEPTSEASDDSHKPEQERSTARPED
jgi:hypothetical protein